VLLSHLFVKNPILYYLLQIQYEIWREALSTVLLRALDRCQAGSAFCPFALALVVIIVPWVWLVCRYAATAQASCCPARPPRRRLLLVVLISVAIPGAHTQRKTAVANHCSSARGGVICPPPTTARDASMRRPEASKTTKHLQQQQQSCRKHRVVLRAI
jgi:hypothetical protein